jgi:hypothetical protein
VALRLREDLADAAEQLRSLREIGEPQEPLVY